jgi:hypothetical protein
VQWQTSTRDAGWTATIWYHMAIARTQTLVQLTDELLALLDERAARSRRSRSELIRDAIESYFADGAEAEIDRRIVEGYERTPPEPIDYEGVAKRAIVAEPW